MKLKTYDVAIIISEPGLDFDDMDATTMAKVTLKGVPRENLTKMSFPMTGLLETFENVLDSVEEG